MTLSERIEREGQKKLLAIDGGGIRGVLAQGVLQGIENLLKEKPASRLSPCRLLQLHRRN
jgi:hypothetical protein